MKASVVAGILGALALCAVFVAVHQDTAADVAREEIGAVPENTFVESEMRQQMFMAVGSGAKKKYTTPVKHEASLRKLIHTSIKVASKSLEKAHGAKEKAAAKAAVKAALADAGVADADNAGTVAWARRNLAVAKKWATHALKRDAQSLGKVSAWTQGDRDTGKKMRRKCERAVQAMIAVASATKNKEMVAREDKLRQEGKLKSYDTAIKNARQASIFAGKSVDKARAALAATLGDKARIAAKHALIRAQDALHDANTILSLEVKKKNVITSNRLESDGGKLVGENEIHFRARKTFHAANRVLKLVEAALNDARKNHYAHKEAVMKRSQKVTMEKAAKLADKERTAKSEAKRKALGIKTKQEYAAYLANLALKYGRVARDDAKKAAEAGKLAADKAAESAHVKSKLGVKPTSTATVTEALQREEIASDLAAKAAKMEDAIVTGGSIPTAVKALIQDQKGNVKPTMFDEARARAVESHTDIEDDEDFHEFVTHRKRWLKTYKADFQQKMAHLTDTSALSKNIELIGDDKDME
jgi:hypothetical protein